MPRQHFTGPPPTIAGMRAASVLAFFVQCPGWDCGHEAHFTFEELGLPEGMVFLEIARHLHFRCSRCGRRSESVFPDWSDLPRPGHKNFVPRLRWRDD